MAAQIVPIDSLTASQDEARADWLEERRKGIGGSDVHHLFPEESKYGCPKQLWYDKTGKPADFRRTPAEIRIMERGNLLEDVVADIYMAETGRKVVRRNTPYVSKRYPFMRVNIDRRIVAIDDRGPGILEIKTYNPFTWSQIERDGLPISVPLQVQHAMAVTDYKWGAFGPWEPAFNNFAPSDYERNDGLIETIIERETDFWRMVVHKIEPEPLPDFNDKRCKTCPWRMSCRGEEATRLNNALQDGIKVLKTDGVPHDESPEFAELLNDFKQADFYAEVAEAIKDRLKEYMGEQQLLYSPDAQAVAEYKWTKGSRTWDSKALEADAVTIGRHIAFGKWATEKYPDLVAEFCQAASEILPLDRLYKKQGFPTRRFSVSTE